MLPAPMFADTPDDKRVMMAQSGVAATMELISSATLAVVGIGGLEETDDGPTNSAFDDRAEIAQLKRSGARAEILGQFLDAEGAIMATRHDGRVMAAPLASLRGREVVAIVGGLGKARAIQAALKSGLLTGLIIDEATARALVGDGGAALAAE